MISPMNPMFSLSLNRSFRFVTALLLLLVLNFGCAGFKTNNVQEFNLITSSRTPLYKTGPSQNVPDTYLEEGTRIRMIRPEGNSILVETTYGLQGYIAGTDIKAAPQN